MIFFITLFRYFTIVLFFTLHFFSFSQGMQIRERAHCARSVFPFIRKKKKKILLGGRHTPGDDTIMKINRKHINIIMENQKR